MNPEERIKQIHKEITMVSIIDTPGAVLLGLGLFARFESEGDPFFPFLNNQLIIDGMIVVGSVIMIWGVLRVISLAKEMAKLKSRVRE